MNKKLIFIYIITLLIISTLIPISFADTQTANAYKINTQTVSLRIEGINENIFYDNSYKANYFDSSLTLLDVIEQAVGKENVTTINSYYGGKYITKINNLEESILDNGEYVGWQYRVNNIEINNTVDDYNINSYDKIVVYYGTLDTEPSKDENMNKRILTEDYTLNNINAKPNDISDERVDLLVSMGIVKGETDGNFYPENNITRAEVLTLLANLSREEIKKENPKVFKDTPVDEWYFDIVMWGYNKGIVSGHENNLFEPDEYITREDLAVMFIKYIERVEGYQFEDNEPLFDDTIDMFDYSKSAVANLAKLKIVKGKPNNKFDPKGFASRYETIIILTNLLDMKYDDVEF